MTQKRTSCLAIISLCMTFCFIACKKYPEDGKHSWHRPEKRILGLWYLKEFLIDGADSTYKFYFINDAIYGAVKFQLFDCKFDFTNYSKKDHQSTVGQVLDISTQNVTVDGITACPSCYLHTTSKWELKNKKTVVSFNTNDNYLNTDTVEKSYSILTIAENDNWSIEKLTDKEIILEANSNNNRHLRLKLQK